jgi:hypothetical protein
MRRTLLPPACAGLLTALAACGCASGNARETAEALHIKKVYALAHAFREENRGQVPRNLEALKTWATKGGKAADPDFLSPRDQKPYVLLAVPSPINLVMLHEKEGKDGKKYVVNVGGSASEVDDAELKRQITQLPKPVRLPGG